MVQDLRLALRSFLRAPRFTIPALLALGLGLGASAAIVSVVRAVLLEPLPYRDPSRIVVVWENNLRRNRPRNVISPANFVAWRERSRTLQNLAMAGPSHIDVMIEGQPQEVEGFFASSDLFQALGVRPVLGRAYTADEDLVGRDDVLVVSDSFWRGRLGGRAKAIGASLVVNGKPRTVVGVMPPGFTLVGQEADFLAPYGWDMEELRTQPGRGNSFGIARLRDGVTLEQAAAEMRGLMDGLAREAPQRDSGWSATLVPVHEQMVDAIRPAIRIVIGAAALLLLLACVNVSNLMLVRGSVRAPELGVRAALGAGRGRIARLLLGESLLLGVLGGALGLGLAALFHDALIRFVAEHLPVPRLDRAALDLQAVLFAFALSLLCGVLCGFVPAMVASRDVNDALRQGGRHGASRGARRWLSRLVMAEVAIAMVLLSCAGLLIRSFVRLQAIDPGFRAEGVLTARVQVPDDSYPDAEHSSAFYTAALERIAAVPGVRDAAAVSYLPLSGPGIGTSFHRADAPLPQPGQAPTGEVRPVTPGWFRTMGIPRISGRDFTAADAPGSAPVAIVSETLVRREFAGQDPIGRRLHVSVATAEGVEAEIVGVVGDIRIASLDGEIRPAIYLPHTQLAVGVMTFVTRSDRDPHTLVPEVTAAVHAVDPSLPLAEVRSMREVVDRTLARPRVIATLLAAFSGAALLLAAVGVYGVMAYSVSRRTREIGVRMAVGATPAAVLWLVLRDGSLLVGGGIAAGLVLTAAVTRLLREFLYDVGAFDPATFATTALLLAAIGMLASLLPARRGTRIDPTEALRVD
jgi:putative ABC transport system permease protein